MTTATATPKSDRMIRLRDGRALAFCEWGDLQGTPVVLFHGTPGSRLLCPDEDATEGAGIRLITIDRAGYGRSDPLPDRTYFDWVDDYVEMVEQLGLPPCPIVGWSSGGPYALACGARLPGRVTAIGLAASVGPIGEVPGARDKLEPDEKVVAELRDRDRAAALAEIRRLSQWYADDSDAAFDDLGSASDNELVGRPEILEPLRRWMREGARQGSAGYEADWIAEWGPWGFSVADIVPDAYVWWGDADALVGRSHTDYLAKTLQRSTVMTYPGEGHLFPVNHWAEMLGALR